MPKIKSIEKRIWDLEGFDVQFKANGKDVRGDKDGIPQYTYEKMAKNDMTVSDWRKCRFKKVYPGFTVWVLDGNGKKVAGQMKLGTVRDSYSDE